MSICSHCHIRLADDGYKTCFFCRARNHAGRPPRGQGTRPPKTPRPDLVGHMVHVAGPRAGDGEHPLGECALYSGCLDTASRLGGHASCPGDCRWHEPAPALRATAYTSATGRIHREGR
jgi:hypothetical protein